ncbi:hypothetical protein [Actinopolyspora lacussalsi]|uniref:hypothetical protein n=1 Tax=Actinopolyspora righensis TaxID=995060 RepID=UPI001113793E|nr:hypothetical protein [Actinopolyspora righensis]
MLREVVRALSPGGWMSIADPTVHEASTQERYNSSETFSTEVMYIMSRSGSKKPAKCGTRRISDTCWYRRKTGVIMIDPQLEA